MHDYIICDLCKGSGANRTRSHFDGVTAENPCNKCDGHRVLIKTTRTILTKATEPFRFSLEIIDKGTPND